MRKFTWGLLAAALLSGLAADPSRAADPVPPDARGIIELAGQTEKGEPIRVRITLRASNLADRAAARVQEKDKVGNDWWGADDTNIHGILATLEVRVGDDYLPLFRSAYGDLADVRGADLVTTKKGFSIIINGGETGTGYVARLHFKRRFLIGRDVTHNEMGLEEKTDYFPVHDN
jgi:hypothetical protein